MADDRIQGGLEIATLIAAELKGAVYHTQATRSRTHDRIGLLGGGGHGAGDGGGVLAEAEAPLRLVVGAAVRLALNQPHTASQIRVALVSVLDMQNRHADTSGAGPTMKASDSDGFPQTWCRGDSGSCVGSAHGGVSGGGGGQPSSSSRRWLESGIHWIDAGVGSAVEEEDDGLGDDLNDNGAPDRSGALSAGGAASPVPAAGGAAAAEPSDDLLLDFFGGGFATYKMK